MIHQQSRECMIKVDSGLLAERPGQFSLAASEFFMPKADVRLKCVQLWTHASNQSSSLQRHSGLPDQVIRQHQADN